MQYLSLGKVSVTNLGRPIRPALISGFRSMKPVGVFILPLGWDASPLQGYPQHYAGTHLYTWVERGTVIVKCLAQEDNTMSPARPRTRTTRSRVERTNHEATVPICHYGNLIIFHPTPVIRQTLDSNDQNQVADQRFLVKQWFAGGTQSHRLRKPGCGHCYFKVFPVIRPPRLCG